MKNDENVAVARTVEEVADLDFKSHTQTSTDPFWTLWHCTKNYAQKEVVELYYIFQSIDTKYILYSLGRWGGGGGASSNFTLIPWCHNKGMEKKNTWVTTEKSLIFTRFQGYIFRYTTPFNAFLSLECTEIILMWKTLHF